jgi:hypothetical protein
MTQYPTHLEYAEECFRNSLNPALHKWRRNWETNVWMHLLWAIGGKDVP